jgi:hypothetical protein
MTVESSVKSVILKDSQTIPSSFISNAYQHAPTVSTDFSKVLVTSSKSKTMVKNSLSLAQLSTAGGIKASIGGEEFVMYRTNDLKQEDEVEVEVEMGHSRRGSNDVEYIELDVFEQYEDRLEDFLKTTPYIDQLIETSKQYRMFIELLKILESFNQELSGVLQRVRVLGKKGKEICVNRVKGQNMIAKNKNLRVQIKSLINDDPTNTSLNSSNKGSTKRALIQKRDVLLDKNSKLMFKFKKAFLL